MNSDILKVYTVKFFSLNLTSWNRQVSISQTVWLFYVLSFCIIVAVTVKKFPTIQKLPIKSIKLLERFLWKILLNKLKVNGIKDVQ